MNGEPRDHEARQGSAREEQLAAYLHGEMTQQERGEFERMLEKYPTLQKELRQLEETIAAAREWMAEEPPGAERVDQLPLPRLADARTTTTDRSKAPSPLSLYAWRGFAAAAIFLFGFYIGQLRPLMEPTSDESATLQMHSESAPPKQAESDVEVKSEQPPQAPATPADEQTVELAEIPQIELRSASEQRDAVIRERYERDGKIYIESRRRESGASSLWVVDGSFSLAMNDK